MWIRKKISVNKLLYWNEKEKHDYLAVPQNNSDYQEILKDIKEKGMINPLQVTKEGDHYRVWEGNTRLSMMRSGDLDLKEVDCIILPNSNIETRKKSRRENYQAGLPGTIKNKDDNN